MLRQIMKVACCGSGYVGTPTMAVLALNNPSVQVPLPLYPVLRLRRKRPINRQMAAELPHPLIRPERASSPHPRQKPALHQRHPQGLLRRRRYLYCGADAHQGQRGGVWRGLRYELCGECE